MACEVVQLESPEDVDQFFREGRTYFNEKYVKKMANMSAWYGRTPVKQWPIGTPPEQLGFRFGRGFYDECCPFKEIVADRCESNVCDVETSKVRRPGHSTYTWQLGRRRFETDWFCVEDFMFRLFPLEEITQFVDTLALVARHINEEFARSYYIGGAGHKWAAQVSDDGLDCDLLDDGSWFMEEHDGVGEMGYNPCYVRVNMNPAELGSMSMLTLDMLDEALIGLQDEDDAYRLDLTDAMKLPLLDVIVPDVKVLNVLYKMAKEENSNLDSIAGYDEKMSALRLGVHRVLSHYAFGYDIDAYRFNLDSAFEATRGQPGGPAAWVPGGPNLAINWPRLIRVPRYIEEADELGYSWVPNPAYHNADFGISVVHVQNAITKWVRPSYKGVGPMVEGDFQPNHMMDWKWRRPDWPENRWGEYGFWAAQFMWGMQIEDPTLMHCFLHRLPKRRRLKKECCPIINNYVGPTPISNYDCQGLEPVSAMQAARVLGASKTAPKEILAGSKKPVAIKRK